MLGVVEKLKNRAFLMVIKVKTDDLRFPIIIPIPLPLVEDIIISICRLGRYGFKILPKLQKHFRFNFDEYHEFWSIKVKGEVILEAIIELVHQLQYFGQFTLVEVKDEDTHVSIRLY